MLMNWPKHFAPQSLTDSLYVDSCFEKSTPRRNPLQPTALANTLSQGSLPRLVSDLCPHKHILKIDIERPSDADHIDDDSICICLILVFAIGVPLHSYTSVETNYPDPSTWNSLPIP